MSSSESGEFTPIWVDTIRPGSFSFTANSRAICPDLLSIRDIGGADGWRGHVVRGFFRLLRVVTGV